MFVLRYDNLNFDANQLPDFVESVKNHQYGKRLILKDKVASGDYRILEFPNGFVAWVSNYIMNDDFELELSVKKEDYLALHINQIQAGQEFKISLNNKAVSYDDKIVTSLFLTTGNDSFVLSGTKGACFNRLKIMIPKIWLTKNLPSYNEDLLNAYLNLQDERFYLDAMDNTYRSMVDKVMNTEDNAFYLSVTQNIVVLITERFFNRLNTKMQKHQKENEVSNKLA